MGMSRTNSGRTGTRGMGAGWRRAAVFAGLAGSMVSVAQAAPPEYAALVQQAQPLVWYRFGEASGTAVTNSGTLGAAQNATAFNGVIRNEPTAAGDAGVGFNPTTQPYIESANLVPASLTGNPTFSIEIIVRVDGPASLWAPFLHWGQGGTGREVYFSARNSEENRVYAGFYNSGLRTVCKTGTGPGKWYHIVWVRDAGNGGNNSLTGTTVYVNGEAVDLVRDEFLQGAVTPTVVATTLRIQKARDFTRYWGGVLDELALYGRVLSVEEIQERYATLNFGLQLKFCPADFNGDCLVDDFDFTLFATYYNNFVDTRGDLDGNGLTDDTDFVLFAQAYNNFVCE